MSNPTPPEVRPDAVGSAFFPSLQQEMNRLFNQFGASFPMSPAVLTPKFPTSKMLAIDLLETDEAIEVTAEVPGMKETDIEVTISGDILTLKGEKSSDHEEKEDNYHIVERQYGSFRRQIPLGFTPDDGATSADFSDGVLKLRIAKPATAKAEVKKIKIKKT